MKITLIALGSQGDVQPYVALGVALHGIGHSVRLVSHDNYRELVTSHGLEFWPVAGDVQELMKTEEMRELLAEGNFLKIAARTGREAQKAAVLWAEQGLAACEGSDLLVAGVGGLYTSLAFAEKLDIPLVQANVFPFTPTRAFAGVLFPPATSRLGGWANRLSHHLTRQVMWQGIRAADNTARQKVLKLAPAPLHGPYRSRRLREGLTLYGFSPAVIPKPPDWDDHTHVTGYWFLDPAPGWTPPLDLVTFIEDGPPPVYIGFGSMGSRKPEETAHLILQALDETGQRGVLLAGWEGLRAERLPNSVYLAGSVPHSWLFPRMAAVVHHGGAGTTAAGLRAGVPSVVVPFFGDQGFWGRKVADLRVGPWPVPRKQLTAERLAAAIRRATSDEGMSRRAASLGQKIRAEDGTARAAEIIGKVKLR
jgi:sterol 3beta-glucosyltransferase